MHRFYHVPASNTAVGHLILENALSAMKVVVAGVGAFGQKHLDAIKQIDGVEVAVGRRPAARSRRRRSRRSTASRMRRRELAEALAQPGVDAVILCTPTQMHAQQAIQCMKAGKHVQVEIPLADSWEDAQAVDAGAEADRPGLHGRTHASLQSVASVDPQAHRAPAS